MTTPQLEPTGRDSRLDLFRGLANWAIFLDHVPNNAVAWITLKHYGFSDAAELFVFISGYTVASVSAQVMRLRGFVAAAFGMLSRVWHVYAAYTLLFVFYVVAIGYVAQGYNHAHLLDEFNIRRLIADPIEFLKHGLLLEYKPFNLDVLPLYVVLMAAFPPVLWLLTKRPNATLIGCVALYVAAQALGWNLPAYPDGGWYFNPFAWQLLFVIGAWVALGGLSAHQALVRSTPLLIAAVSFLLFAGAVTFLSRIGSGELVPGAVRDVFMPNDKTNLAPYRIVHFLALALIVYRLVPRDAPFLAFAICRPLLACGRQSLEVFCAGVFLAFVAFFVLELISNALLFQIVVSIAGIGTMTAVAYFCIWTKEFGSASRAHDASAGLRAAKDA